MEEDEEKGELEEPPTLVPSIGQLTAPKNVVPLVPPLSAWPRTILISVQSVANLLSKSPSDGRTSRRVSSKLLFFQRGSENCGGRTQRNGRQSSPGAYESSFEAGNAVRATPGKNSLRSSLHSATEDARACNEEERERT